jgi:hypothetical protein
LCAQRWASLIFKGVHNVGLLHTSGVRTVWAHSSSGVCPVKGSLIFRGVHNEGKTFL